VRIGSSSRSLPESNTLGVVSEHESWPGEEPEPANGEVDLEEASDEDADAESDDEDTGDGEPELRLAGHDAGELDIPDDVNVLEGESRSTRRGVGIVVSRANVDVANRLLESALAELDRAGVGREQVLVMAVPTAFELPIGAMALAKTRRYVCIVAVGSASDSAVVAAEAASGLQLTALETGVPVAFGLITDAAEDAVERGAEAVRNALEMADLFQQLRATAQAAK
jgi:6,7-dimethyl-8-ribityllumazine synthase